MITTDKYEQGEGTIISGITTGNNDGTYTLLAGSSDKGQTIQNVYVTAPGAVGDLQITFYDDTPATTKLKGPYPLASQPPLGFELRKTVSSGKLGYRISGWTSGSTKVYLNITYSI